tara:strand:- start:140 stop:388 length:249 start_codon:yes stop_codon:yes gene_type:complete
MNKLGSYISKLMTTVIDKEQEQFVKDLALNELERLNVDVNAFIRQHKEDMFDKAKKHEEAKKQLLQEQENKQSEDNKDVKNK